MKETIHSFIRGCEICQKNKLTRIKTKQPMSITDTPFEPFEKISIDTVGPLPMTPDGNVHILTIQDNFSKAAAAVPIPDIRAVTVADALLNHYIALYGCPRVILSDKGTSFTSKLIQQLAKALRIQRLTTSSYYPQGNASLERSHQPLVDYLRVFVDRFRDWDRYVPMAMFNYNTTVHTATKFTPYEVLFGRKARNPTQFPDFKRIETYNDYLADLISRLSEIQKISSDNLIRAKNESKIRFDKHIHPADFRVNDMIYVLKEPRKNKLDHFYTGPFKILEINDFGGLIVEKSNGRRKLIHPNKAKHAYPEPVDKKNL